MSIQKDNPDKRTDAAELAAIQRNSVTVPADKLAELQRKAGMVDDLVDVLESLIFDVPTDTVRCRGDKCRELYCESCNGEEDAEIAIKEIMSKVGKAIKAITKAKEQSCSTLCHPEEECFITESGKCEAKGE